MSIIHEHSTCTYYVPIGSCVSLARSDLSRIVQSLSLSHERWKYSWKLNTHRWENCTDRPRCSQRGDAIWGRRNFVCAENVCHKGFCSASSFFRDHRIAREKWPPKWCHGQTASTIAAQTGQWSKKEREKAAGEGRRVINRRRDDGGRRCRRCRRRLKIFLPGNKRHTTTGWRTSPLSPRYGRARSRPLDHRDEIIFQPLADCSRSSRLELCPSASRARAKRAEKRSPRVTSV